MIKSGCDPCSNWIPQHISNGDFQESVILNKNGLKSLLKHIPFPSGLLAINGTKVSIYLPHEISHSTVAVGQYQVVMVVHNTISKKSNPQLLLLIEQYLKKFTF